MAKDPLDSSLLPALLWLLLSRQLLPTSSLDTATAAAAILALIRTCLEQTGSDNSTVALQLVLDCVSLSLALPEVQSAVDEEWVASVVPLVAGLLEEDGEELTSYSGSYVVPLLY